MADNLIIMHGGGPTAVINASLYGAIRQAQAASEVGRIYVALGGPGGFLHEKLPSAPAAMRWKPPSTRPCSLCLRNTASATC